MSSDTNIIQLCVQAGAVGLCALSMWVNYKLASNHINHNTESNERLTNAISRLAQLIEDKIK